LGLFTGILEPLALTGDELLPLPTESPDAEPNDRDINPFAFADPAPTPDADPAPTPDAATP
jgi:hypothetical protein